MYSDLATRNRIAWGTIGGIREVDDVRADARAGGVTPTVQQMLDTMLGSHQVLESVPNIISVKDRQHRILYMNHVVPGHRVSDMLGTNALSHVAPEDRERYQEVFERAWTSGESQTLTLKTVGDQYLETTFVPLKQGSQVVFMMGSNQRHHRAPARRGGAARERAAPAARDHGQRHGHLGDPARQDHLGRRRCARSSAFAPRRRRATCEEFLAMVHPEDRELVSRIVARHRETGVVRGLRAPPGAAERRGAPGALARHADPRRQAGHAIGFLGGVFDITARKRLEAQLHQAQKMEAVGS